MTGYGSSAVPSWREKVIFWKSNIERLKYCCHPWVIHWLQKLKNPMLKSFPFLPGKKLPLPENRQARAQIINAGTPPYGEISSAFSGSPAILFLFKRAV